MTKKYIGIQLIILSLTISCSKYQKSDTWNYNGKVSKITEHRYEAVYSFGEWSNGDYKDGVTYLFDEYGSPLNEIHFDKNKNVSFKMTFEYLDNDRKVFEQNYYDANNKKYQRIVGQYVKPSLIEGVIYNHDNSDQKVIWHLMNSLTDEIIIYDYDNKGELVEKRKEKFNRNSKGWLISNTITINENSYVGEYEYLIFDQKDNWTQKLYYDENDSSTPLSITFREYEYF